MKKENKIAFSYSKIVLLILITIIFIVIPTKTILSSPLTYVPLDSWVYPAISRLETLAAFEGNDSIATNTLPLTRMEIACLINTALSNLQKGEIEFKDSDLTLLEKLVLEFQDALSDQGLKIAKIDKTEIIIDDSKSTSEIKPYFTQKVDLCFQDKKIEDLKNIYLFSELGVNVSAEISENSSVYLDCSADFNYSPEEEAGGFLEAKINKAYISAKLPSFTIFPSSNSIGISSLYLSIGRDSMEWGPAYQGSLILSDNAPAFDMLKYSGTIDLDGLIEGLGKVNFTKYYSLFDTLYEHDRFFLGQRLEYKPFDALTLGLSETAVISRDPSISTILFYNPIPFIPPYVVTRIIAEKFGISSVINSYVGIDAELNFQPGIKLYGELMIDDLHFEPEYLHPNRTGFLAGAYFADPLGNGNTDFRIEYTHINNYVYYHTQSWQDYLYQGEYIGNPLGPDADQIYLELTHRLSDKFNLSLSYTYERHGEGQVGIALPSDPVVANENIFLSGIIEKKNAYKAGISYDISSRWDIAGSVTLENIENKDNDLGTNENNIYLQMELNYQF